MTHRLLFGVSTLLALGSLAAGWAMLPEGRIPIHFGDDGTPDGWGSRAQLLGTLGTVTVLMGLFLGWLAAKLPSMGWTFVNVPRKDHWSRPENEARAKARCQDDLYLVGSWTMWLLAALPLLIARSVNGALETGRSGNADIAAVLVGAALLLVGVFWRQRWYHQNVEE